MHASSWVSEVAQKLGNAWEGSTSREFLRLQFGEVDGIVGRINWEMGPSVENLSGLEMWCVSKQAR